MRVIRGVSDLTTEELKAIAAEGGSESGSSDEEFDKGRNRGRR
jgi:hypothetical protein